jgi:quinol-cytochrome oxidoreductase complex cytochrome b subunit
VTGGGTGDRARTRGPGPWAAVVLAARVAPLGNLLDMVPSAMFLHVFLAYPPGQLTSRPRQLVVIAGYVNVVVLQLAKILLGSNPDSLLAITAQPALASRIEQFQLIAMSALLLIGSASVISTITTRRAGPSVGG